MQGHRVGRGTSLVAAGLLAVACSATRGAAVRPDGDGDGAGAGGSWVGTWACGPQLTEPGNLPPAPGLSGNTLRQMVYVSIGGSRLRVRLSNEFGDGPVTMNAVHLAVASGGGAIDVTTDRALAFSGAASVTIPAGQAIFSDAFDYALPPQATMAITIAFGSAPAGVTGHPGSRTTSYLQTGDNAAAASLTTPALPARTADHWYYVTGIDVAAGAGNAAVVTLGDSITDGRGSTTNMNDRWPDDLSRRLRANAATAAVAVLNQGIGGNALVSGGLGPTAVQRYTRDVLDQRGARSVIILEGVNDIGASVSNGGQGVAATLIAAFGQMIDRAHARGIRAYGVPILPFAGSHYDSPDHEASRQAVNAWIRGSGRFDAVIDLEAAVRDPAHTTALLSAYDSGDHLHLSPAGYQQMADAIDLGLFTP